MRQWIEAAKTWTPILFDETRSGGYGYLSFQVLKVPDLASDGQRAHEHDTDETAAARPGQEFITVEGIFTASSDGIVVIISPPATT